MVVGSELGLSIGGFVRIRILGPLEVYRADGSCQVAGQKLRTVLAVLALHANKVVPREHLVEELWMDAPPTSAENAVQAHVMRLRRLLDAHFGGGAGRHLIQTVGGGYTLCIQHEDVDANRFTAMAERGGLISVSDPEEAVRILREALQLWQGPALLDTGEGMLCRTAVSQLEEIRLVAQEDLIQAKLALGLHRSVVAELRQLVARHPFRERNCEQLMLALYRSGRQADALDVYQRVRDRMVEELGLEPGHALQTSLQRILVQDEALARRRA